MKKFSICALLLASALAAGCNFQNKTSLFTPTAPTAAGGSSTSTSSPAPESTGSVFSGTWGSGTFPGLPNTSSCTNLQWSISKLADTSVAGTISAVCGGSVTVTADVTGQLKDSDTVDLTANGSAVAVGITCGFQLTGVGHRETNDSMRLDYQGTTCLGPVTGTEMLRRASPPPAPAPNPQSEPGPPSDPNDVLFGCGGIQDNYALVECIHSHIRPTDQYSAFEVTKRVAWALRDRGGAGLLIKPAGENIVTWRGYTFAAARICYPDGHIYKVLSDVGPGGANGPSWQDEGFIDRNRYVPAMDPALP